MRKLVKDPGPVETATASTCATVHPALPSSRCRAGASHSRCRRGTNSLITATVSLSCNSATLPRLVAVSIARMRTASEPGARERGNQGTQTDSFPRSLVPAFPRSRLSEFQSQHTCYFIVTRSLRHEFQQARFLAIDEPDGNPQVFGGQQRPGLLRPLEH